MTISVYQQVDYLWKKLGYGVAKTAIPSVKDATNESIVSAPFLPGDRIWTQSELIPSVLPSASASVVTVYTGASAIRCNMDITATPNRTWLTNLTDWVPTEYGSTYQVKVFLSPTASSSPHLDGVQLYAAGTNNNDEWFFDYESGVVHFIGDNLPAQSFSGKSIFVSGGRYTGNKGLGNLSAGTFGNLTISGYTISSSANIILSPSGVVDLNGAIITNSGTPTNPSDVATVGYVTSSLSSLNPNKIWQGDSNVTITDVGVGILTITLDGNTVSTFSNSSASIANLTISNNTVSSSSDLVLASAAGNSIVASATTALRVPVGTTSERPVVPTAGDVRFNTTSGILECFNGTSWISAQSQINSQVIIGDGVTNTFTLVQPSYSTNIIVAIQGVIQLPEVAYTVVGTQLTFAEPPLALETIEVRFISQSVSTVATFSTLNVVDSPTVTVDTTESIIDSFNFGTYRSAKYTLSVTYADGNAQLIDVLLVHNGILGAAYSVDTTHAVTASSVTNGVANSLTFSSYAWATSCVLTAISTDSNTKIKILKTYFVH